MDAADIHREIAAAKRIAQYLDDRVSARAIERYLAELQTRRLFTELGQAKAPAGGTARGDGREPAI
jgi:hypothetical protein